MKSDQIPMFEEEAAPPPPVYTSDAERYEAGRQAERAVTEAFYAKVAEIASVLGFVPEWTDDHKTYYWPHSVQAFDPRKPERGYSFRLAKGRIEIHGILGDLHEYTRYGGDYGDQQAEISVNMKRSAKDIAADIYSRVYRPYLDLRRVLEERKAATQADSARKREIGRKLEAAGGPAARYEEKDDGRTMIKVTVTNGYNRPYGHGPRADCEVITYDHERVNIKLTDLPVELAERIMQTLGEYTS